VDSSNRYRIKRVAPIACQGPLANIGDSLLLTLVGIVHGQSVSTLSNMCSHIIGSGVSGSRPVCRKAHSISVLPDTRLWAAFLEA